MAGCCPKIKNKFLYIIMPIIVGIATSGLIFQNLYFIPALQTQSRRIFLQTSSISLYIMTFISYYYAINLKNSIPPTIIPPRIKHQLKSNHPLYTQKKLCEKQGQKYKPPRTSHCHVCKCVARMDHHCPYTNNCVGGRNLKSFILFCGYGGIFALQFFSLSIVYYFKLSQGKVGKISQMSVTIWMLLTFIAFLLSFSMNGLAISNILMAGKNITQIQMLKGIFLFRDKHGVHPNPYDLGFFTNINTVFGGDYWLFWWPTPIRSQNDFTQFPMRPVVTNAQIKTLPASIQKQLQEPSLKLIPKTIEQLRKQEQHNYQGVIFFYLGKPYQLMRQQIKETLAEINNVKIDQQEVNVDKQQKQKVQTNQPTQQDKQILADLYDQ